MNHRKSLVIALAGTLLLGLAACTPKKAVRPTPQSVPVTQADGAQGAGAGGGLNPGGVQSVTVGNAGAAGQGSAPAGVERVFYFDFDSSEVRPEYTAALASHARTLAGKAAVKVRLEGHTDERGSPEYNIGLGERRAQAVRRALLLQGVGEAQVATVSYGEERPAVAGQGEEAWAKNRFVEIVYLN